MFEQAGLLSEQAGFRTLTLSDLSYPVEILTSQSCPMLLQLCTDLEIPAPFPGICSRMINGSRCLSVHQQHVYPKLLFS